MHDGVDVVFVFLHFLPEADGLFHLLRVDVFRPAALYVVDAAGFHLHPLGVDLGGSAD